MLSCVYIGVVVTTLNSLPWFPCCMKFECFLISHLWSKAKQAWGETRERLTLNFFSSFFSSLQRLPDQRVLTSAQLSGPDPVFSHPELGPTHRCHRRILRLPFQASGHSELARQPDCCNLSRLLIFRLIVGKIFSRGIANKIELFLNGSSSLVLFAVTFQSQ